MNQTSQIWGNLKIGKQTNSVCTPNTKQIFSSRYCWNVSISSLLTGLCDNTSCKCSALVEIFQLAWKMCLQAYIACSGETNSRLCINSVCNLLIKGLLHPKMKTLIINHLPPCHSKPVKALFVFGTQFKIFWMKTGRLVTVPLTP